MAKISKKHMLEKSLEVIKKYNLVFISELFAYVDFGSATFYASDMEKSEKIKEAISQNKIKIKKSLQKKWHDGNNAITQLALYKLIGTKTEREAISNAQVEVKGKVKVETFQVGYKEEDKEKPSPKKEDGEQ